MWPNPQETADLVTFIEEILNEKVHFFVQCINFSQFTFSLFQITFWFHYFLFYLFTANLLLLILLTFSNGLKSLDFLRKKLHLRCLTGFWIRQ